MTKDRVRQLSKECAEQCLLVPFHEVDRVIAGMLLAALDESWGESMVIVFVSRNGSVSFGANPQQLEQLKNMAGTELYVRRAALKEGM